jgi:L-threonylcarbamoyladenylate synthase
MTIKSVSESVIAEAAELLKSGGCIAIPTETVYGLAADATNGQAVAQIFDIKDRPTFNPLISHFYSLNHLQNYVDLNDTAKKLASAFWPGPMTLIVKRSKNCKISDLTCAGLNTIAVRIPAHLTAQKIIRAAGLPLAAPSANKSGEVSPTSATHVADSLGANAPLIIADGQSKIGLESTVIDCTNDRAVIARMGAITPKDCEAALGYRPAVADSNDEKPVSPGQLLKHYAPKTPLRLRVYGVEKGEALLAFGSTKFMNVGAAQKVMNLSEAGDLHEAASNLFSYLRQLDKINAPCISVMDIPNQGIGLAINDRLKRAAER